MLNRDYIFTQSDYQTPKPLNTWVFSANKKTKFTFKGDENEPNISLLKSVIKALRDREAGKASPIFSSVKEMKEWVDKNE